MIAEIGLIGQPNSGKSTLLKCLTKANVKIGDYPFTTLFPNLGTLKVLDREIIVADIPGLIEGASEGKGLGQDFLRHIDRTHSLIHLIAANETPNKALENYFITINELKNSPYNLLNKNILTILSKSDMVTEQTINETITLFSENSITLYDVSSFTNKGIGRLIKDILRLV